MARKEQDSMKRSGRQTIHWSRPKNEVAGFLVNFFFLEVTGQMGVRGLEYLFRFFGMPQFYYFTHTTPYFHQILFTILLIIAITISVVGILKKKKDEEKAKMGNNTHN